MLGFSFGFFSYYRANILYKKEIMCYFSFSNHLFFLVDYCHIDIVVQKLISSKFFGQYIGFLQFSGFKFAKVLHRGATFVEEDLNEILSASLRMIYFKETNKFTY